MTAVMSRPSQHKPCIFLGSSRKDLRNFPEEVRASVGHSIHEVQSGLEPYTAKALKGFAGRGILELVEDHEGNTYRAVYTVRFATVVYILHCFQKKSKTGVATPKRDINLVKIRLREAEVDYAQHFKQEPKP